MYNLSEEDICSEVPEGTTTDHLLRNRRTLLCSTALLHFDSKYNKFIIINIIIISGTNFKDIPQNHL